LPGGWTPAAPHIRPTCRRSGRDWSRYGSYKDASYYHSNKRSYHEIRRTSDRICKEHGLSVIIPGRDKSKSHIEHQAEQNGTSYKAKLRAAIDRLLPGCVGLEDLLRCLQREGYELKRGKYISARAPG